MKISWKVMGILVGCIAVIGIITAIAMFSAQKSKNAVCSKVTIEIMDSADYHFVTVENLRQLLKNKGIKMLGEHMTNISLPTINQYILQNPYVARMECYKTPNHQVKIKVWQRHPVVEIMGKTNYYLDESGHKLPVGGERTALVPIVSGNVNDSLVQNKFFPMISYIHQDPFWNAQIEQIYFQNDSIIELVPRLGDCIIRLGTIDRYQQKMDKLMVFYQQALNHVGWNRYSYIDLQYKDRVICTKKETTAENVSAEIKH
ncbi:MAG: cell division protein FtsQ/DivIB [Microbacter sp.]